MGLDQWLKYVSDDGYSSEKYFRKCNWLRNWVIQNTELSHDSDTEEVELTRPQLEDLKEKCEDVLQHKEKADELLPTLGGFFFGSYEYDEWYFDQVKSVKNDLEEILANKNWEEVIYTDWW